MPDRDYFAGGQSQYNESGNIRLVRLPAGNQVIGTTPREGEQTYRFQVLAGAETLREAVQAAAAYATEAHRGAEYKINPPLPAVDGTGQPREYYWRLSIDGGAWAGPFPFVVNQPPGTPGELTVSAE